MNLKKNINLGRPVLIKIAVLIWRHVQGTFLNENYFCKLSISNYFLEDKCLENIEKLPLLSGLKENVKNIIKPIGVEVLKFSRNLISRIDCKDYMKQIPVNLVWTEQGAVDTRRTYKLLINDESLDLTFRFKLACHCCLENDIEILWNQMSEEQKSDLLNVRLAVNLVNIWAAEMGNREVPGQLPSQVRFITHESAFIVSASEFNKDAAEFFWKKLCPEDRRNVLPKVMTRFEGNAFYVIHEDCPDYYICDCTQIVLFLFSRGDREPLENLIRFSDYRVLRRLLDWPYHEYFLEIFDSMQLTVGNNAYYGILNKLVYKIVFGFRDFNYGLLIKIFLKQKTKVQKHSDQPIFPSTFNIISFFRADAEAVSLIATYCKTVLKKDVMLVKNICENLSDDEEWELLTFVIDKCILKSKHKIFRSISKVPTSRVNYENLQHFEAIHQILFYLRVLIDNKIKSISLNFD